MTDTSQANKRIAKNTLVIYGQLMLKMFLGLYTSRLALEALGVSDFGLYSVVGGVIALFTIISSPLSSTTVRFINVERGKLDGNLNRVFNVCNVLHLLMALLLFLLFEVGGVYYIHHFLNVDAGRETDAMFVYQVSVAACCLGIVNVPFSSLFNAEEKFLFSAVVDLSAKFVELMFLIWLLTYNGDRLKAYAVIESVYSVVPFAVYHYFAYRRWPEVVSWRFVRVWQRYKEMLVFSTYNLLSSVAMMARGQGSKLLINSFFGTAVNGSFAIAQTVDRNVYPFANGIHKSAVPQITQSYSRGDMERVFFLASRVSKYCLLMTALCLFPLWAELDFVLNIWLVSVPEGAAVFCRVILLMAFVSLSDGGLWDIVNASGRIGAFRVSYSLITLSCLPIGFYVLRSGRQAYVLLVVFLIADFFWRIVQLYMMHRIFRFPTFRYCRDAYLPVLKAALPVVVCLLFTSRVQLDSPLWHFCHFLVILLLTTLSAYYLGLSCDEQKKVLGQFLSRIKSEWKPFKLWNNR